jgi:7-carboxy-7-deazaguanine synthase
MTVAEIRRALANLPGCAPWITISGGNPCIFDLEELIHALRAFKRYKVAIETQATIRPPWLKYCDQIVLSPKPPSSGMETNWEHLGEFMRYSQAVLKVVVFDRDDYLYAKQVHMLFPWVPFYLSVGTLSTDKLPTDLLERLSWLINLNFEDDVMRDVTILPQLHVLIYGHRRGV